MMSCYSLDCGSFATSLSRISTNVPASTVPQCYNSIHHPHTHLSTLVRAAALNCRPCCLQSPDLAYLIWSPPANCKRNLLHASCQLVRQQIQLSQPPALLFSYNNTPSNATKGTCKSTTPFICQHPALVLSTAVLCLSFIYLLSVYIFANSHDRTSRLLSSAPVKLATKIHNILGCY